jgi:alpha-tubulin suppressor-like RCC1 family protein
MSLRRPNGFISAGYDPLEVPNAPTIGVATFASATSVSVTFTAPSNVGGSAITGYVATAKKTSDGTTISGTGSSSPVTISGLTTGDAYTVTVAAVNSFGLGVSSAASNSVTPLNLELYAWGNNGSGRLGLNDTANRSSPVQVGALTDWLQISSGGDASTATKTDGTLWSWGAGGNGQLGLNDTANRSSPVQVGALTAWYQVAGGQFHSIATKSDGTLWSFGGNNQGQLGDGTVVARSSPVQVGTLTNWNNIAAGQTFGVAVKKDGTMWSWGKNNYGQLGIGIADAYSDSAYRSSPVQIGALTDWANVAAGNQHCVAVKTNGTLWSWGFNSSGQLGQGNTDRRSSPVQIGSLTDWRSVTAGGNFSIAVKMNGTLWSWGQNQYGQLGQNNTSYYRSSPVQIGALTTWASSEAGNGHAAAVKADGTMWVWGRNNSGQLGLSDTANRSSPVQVGALITWQRLPKMSQSQSLLALKSP